MSDRGIFLSDSIDSSFLSPVHLGDHRFFHRKQGEKGNSQTGTGGDRGIPGEGENDAGGSGGEEKRTVRNGKKKGRTGK